MPLETLALMISPLEFSALRQWDLSRTLCVVFDVLRATSTMVTALANGTHGIFPVAEISEALAVKRQQPEVLLAGERNGILIGEDLTGGIPFDFGNSPREFVRSRVEGKTIVMTTTNGTRALCACTGAAQTLIGCFLNLETTAEVVRQTTLPQVLLVCAGTEESVAYEDILCAGALIDLVLPKNPEEALSDSARIARAVYLCEQNDLLAGLSKSCNAKRLLSSAALRDDVAFCARRDVLPLLAQLEPDGVVRKVGN